MTDVLNYSFVNDFPNGLAPPQLISEINAEAGITNGTALGLTIDDNDVEIEFDGFLNASEVSIVDAVVAAHIPGSDQPPVNDEDEDVIASNNIKNYYQIDIDANINDGGFMLRRFQIENDDGTGHVVSETSFLDGTAISGGSNYIELDENASQTNDIYNKYWIKITSGTGINQVRRIINYDGTSRIAQVSSWTINPDNTSNYSLYSNGYTGVFYDESVNEWLFGYTSSKPDNTLTTTNISNLRVNDLIAEGDINTIGSYNINGNPLELSNLNDLLLTNLSSNQSLKYNGSKWINVDDIYNNYSATNAPTVNDDSNSGYSIGSNWIDITNDKKYILVDDTTSSAIWKLATLDTTDDLVEGSNLYYTESRVSSNSDVSSNTSHRMNTNNPHSVTIDQITPTTTKGDILVENGSNVIRLGVGTDGYVLTADSNESSGIKWAQAQSSGISEDLSAIQLRRCVDLTLNTSYQNISFDTIDLENDVSVVEQDGTNAYKINIKETGLYRLSYFMKIASNNNAKTESRILVNNTTEIDGSYSQYVEENSGGGDDKEAIHKECLYEFTANDYIVLQAKQTIANSTISECMITIIRQKGSKGEKGTTGAGSSVILKDNSSIVSGSPHDTLNFVGGGVSIADAGSGEATITISANSTFGSEYECASSEGESTTTSENYQTKVNFTTLSKPIGTYRICWYCETNINTNSKDWIVQTILDDNEIGVARQEPKDSGGSEFGSSNQVFAVSGFYFKTFTTATTHNIKINYRSEDDGYTTAIRRARVEIWRIS